MMTEYDAAKDAHDSYYAAIEAKRLRGDADRRLLHGDCLDIMPTLRAGSVDMVLADLPYGTTQNKWDSVIPLDALWREYKRLCRGAVVLTAAQPFTAALIASNISSFRYVWYWRKNRATNVFNAKKQPLRDTEEVCVFGGDKYNPQGLIYKSEMSRNGKKDSENYGSGKTKTYMKEWTNYPKQTLEFDVVQRVEHPTQKPVALMEYLIRTYTNEGDTVLDNTMGSGTTGVACLNTGRKFIGIERDRTYFDIAQKRIQPAPQGAFFMAAE